MKRALRIAMLSALFAACGPGAAEPSNEQTTSHETGDEAIDDGAIDDGATQDEAADDGASPPAQSLADPMARAMVAAHDARRAEHCAPPIAWSDELAQVAQAWADTIRSRGCALQHSSGPYGENLAAGTSGTLTPEQVVEMWASESAHYRYRNARFSMQTGHFTQVVWAGTARVGCGKTTCNGMDVFVCNYDPPGNIEGEFQENVHPTSCR